MSLEDQKQKKGISPSSVILIAAVVFVLGSIFGSSMDFFRATVSTQLDKIASGTNSQDFSLYWDVYNKLKETYVDETKLKKDELYYGTIRGMVESIGDPATAFFDPKETTDYNKSRGGEYSGIGAELDFINKQVVVVAPFEGSPAAKAGIEAGDIIAKVNGESVAGKTVNEVVILIRGESGTEVTVDVVRPRVNKPFTYKIVRGNISAPSMQLKEIKDKVATVKINRFTENTLTEWQTNWQSIASDLRTKVSAGEVNSVILDLRGNPGGYFDAAVFLASDFVPRGSIIALQRGRDTKDKEYPTYNEPMLANVPLVILVNGSSASASEIFAGAMQHYKKATVVGEKTYGKGTAQIVMPLSGGSSLHVTVSKWLLPDGRWINHDDPITPDKVVPFDYDAKDKGIDNQMNSAIEIAKEIGK